MKLDASALKAFELGYGHCLIQGECSIDLDPSTAWNMVCGWEDCDLVLLDISTHDQAVAWLCIHSGYSEAVQFVSLRPDALRPDMH